MSEFDNGTVGGGDPSTAGGEAPRETISLDRSGFTPTYERHEERMAVPSHSDRAAGAPEARWGDTSVEQTVAGRPAAERGSEFGVGHAFEALGLPEATREGARAWLAGGVRMSEDQLAKLDSEHEAAAVGELRALWGDDFLPNLKAIDTYLEGLPGHAGVVFKQARDASGKALANDPATLQRLLGQAKQSGGTSLSGSLAEQIAAIERTMRTDRAAYNRDALLQARYRELLTMREQAR